MHLFINRYGEMRSGWVLSVGVLLSNLLALPSIMLSNLLVAPKYINILPTPISYELMEAGCYILRDVALVIGSLFAFYVCTKRTAYLLGYRKKYLVKNLLLGVTVGGGTITLSFILLWVTGQIEVAEINLSAVTTSSFWLYILIFIGVGIGEETLTRGFMMTALKTTRQPIVVLFLPSLLFSLMHLFNPGFGLVPFVNIFLVGVLFSVLFLRTGNLWAPIAAHFVWNCLQGSIFGLRVSGIQTVSLLDVSVISTKPLLSGGDFGTEGSLILTLALIVGVVLCFVFIKSFDKNAWTLTSNLPFLRKKQSKCTDI